MREEYIRTAMLLGEAGVENLSKKRVAVFGLGGVGGYAAEALARCGVGALDLIDHDSVSRSNLNRQIIAAFDTVGREKTEVMAERIRSFRDDCKLRLFPKFYLPENASEFPLEEYDYVVDAIDTVTAKIDLAVRTRQLGIPFISCMGTGNKLNPGLLQVADIYETSVCPLAKVMRRELRARGVERLKVVYSREEPHKPFMIGKPQGPGEETRQGTKAVPGSVCFVPAAAGLLMAAEVIKELCNQASEEEK